eukprot:6201101-Pleurochrysis_carterae.AAC.1
MTLRSCVASTFPVGQGRHEPSAAQWRLKLNKFIATSRTSLHFPLTESSKAMSRSQVSSKKSCKCVPHAKMVAVCKHEHHITATCTVQSQYSARSRLPAKYLPYSFEAGSRPASS